MIKKSSIIKNLSLKKVLTLFLFIMLFALLFSILLNILFKLRCKNNKNKILEYFDTDDKSEFMNNIKQKYGEPETPNKTLQPFFDPDTYQKFLADINSAISYVNLAESQLGIVV
jgi:hypothetical protein